MGGPERTIAAVLAAASSRLRAAGSPTPRLDAELLLGHVLGRDRTWLLAHGEEVVPEPAALDRLVARRANGVPVAYLRGAKDWHDLRLRTDPRALVPRPETELLADAAVAEIDARLRIGPVVAWDVATGSGAVAVVLARRFTDALRDGSLQLIASDVSTDALALARENLAAHDHEIALVEADLLAPAGSALPRPDVVVANLPYLTTAEVDAGTGSLAHEPRIALDGGSDGLDPIRRLLADLPDRVAPGATVLLEVGAGQADAVASLAPRDASTSIVPDLAGIGRVVRIGVAHSGARCRND